VTVCALEVSSEGFDQVVPAGDLRRRQMLQPGPVCVKEEQGEVTDDEVVIVRSTQLAGQPVVRKPQFWPCFP
jgi:LPS O-antigen subunit length determinant protein (WzzB/FepE family)